MQHKINNLKNFLKYGTRNRILWRDLDFQVPYWLLQILKGRDE